MASSIILTVYTFPGVSIRPFSSPNTIYKRTNKINQIVLKFTLTIQIKKTICNKPKTTIRHNMAQPAVDLPNLFVNLTFYRNGCLAKNMKICLQCF